MLDSFIFDMDGTLFQTDKILEIALEDTFNYLKSIGEWDSITPIEQYRKIMGVPLPTVWATLMPNHSIEVRNNADVYFLNRLIEVIEQGKGDLYPHVQDLFDYLKANQCSIYIASNGLVDYLNAIVNYYQLDRWVTETFSIQQISSLSKSDLVKLIINKYQIKSGAVVGDRLSDIRAAKDNNLLAIGCNFDFAQASELAQADIVIDSLLDIKKVVIARNQSAK